MFFSLNSSRCPFSWEEKGESRLEALKVPFFFKRRGFRG
jgi:hypothetical protein